MVRARSTTCQCVRSNVSSADTSVCALDRLDDAQPHLATQFAYTGATANPVVGLLEESKNNYKYYCTGRRFCSRFVADLEVRARRRNALCLYQD